MLIGAHVSTGGGLVQAHARAVERGCEAMQVFNQSPRQWRPTRWKPDDVAGLRALAEEGAIRSGVDHAAYLNNSATKEKEIRRNSIGTLVHDLNMSAQIGATRGG